MKRRKFDRARSCYSWASVAIIIALAVYAVARQL